MTHSHIGGGDLPRSLPHWENVSSQPSPAVHTLLIDNHDSYTFNVFQYLATINGVAPTVIRNDEFTSWREAKASVGPVHNIVISPGPGTAENEHDFGVCSEALREAAVPILGICLGHQGLGHVYGGKIQRTPRAVHGRRSAIDFIEGYKLFEGVKRGTLVVRYHSLQVDKDNLPKCLEPTCWTTDEDNVLMGIRHRDLPLHGVQFHPESIGTTAGYKILENFRDMTLAWWADRGSEWPYIAPKNTGKHQVAAFAKTCVTYGVDGDRTELSNDVPAPRLELSDDGKAPEPWEATAVPFAFPCGYAGFFGYELRHVTERYVGPDMQQCSLQKDIGNHSTNVPDAAWIFSDRMIVLNHESNELFLSWLTPSLGQDRQSRKSGETAFSGLCPCDPWAFSCDTDKVAAICQSQQQWAEMTLRAIALASSPVSAEPPLVMRASEKAQLSRGRTPDLESPAQRQAADLSMRPTAVGEERNLPPAKGSPVDDTLCALGSDSRAVDASLNGAASGESSEKHSMALSFHDDVQTYKANIRTILDYIAAGEVYEVCLTTELAGALNPSVVSPLQFYGQLRCRNPSPFAAFLRPERFLMKDVDGWLESKPIKGTRPRGKTPEEDRDLVNDLATNEKDMVENLMIVDLVRNDLGGSMTGAPKERAMEIIERLEERPRGIYSGATGFLSVTGEASLNIVIRTVVFTTPNLAVVFPAPRLESASVSYYGFRT
ncbi:putative para-aminobenzoate synthase [Neospora caninum Liverpool]|uniref:aminodeoxychorismate synthase n=1 Tax=Neospora caninum (strain Liverpool) TaxID=572307 RepID=F0VFB7_NEOCL|nr:putative para-aminobenzoate synthase [Neospora caninum Liverpool]CBZ52411.1 putative para-aminobenzoate synthase [Neospora caninum Liverpool]|eukprot:XP_003882443.1 putative para-aminobenzoate synthase [Neospora caninum Liverpool]